jgi:hypothetical protein
MLLFGILSMAHELVFSRLMEDLRLVNVGDMNRLAEVFMVSNRQSQGIAFPVHVPG